MNTNTNPTLANNNVATAAGREGRGLFNGLRSPQILPQQILTPFFTQPTKLTSLNPETDPETPPKHRRNTAETTPKRPETFRPFRRNTSPPFGMSLPRVKTLTTLRKQIHTERHQ